VIVTRNEDELIWTGGGHIRCYFGKECILGTPINTKYPFDHWLEDSNVEMEYTTKDKTFYMVGCQ
jgi:hypothetical protein